MNHVAQFLKETTKCFKYKVSNNKFGVMRIKFDIGIYIQKIEFDNCDQFKIDFKIIEPADCKKFFDSFTISESITDSQFEKVWGKLQKIGKKIHSQLGILDMN